VAVKIKLKRMGKMRNAQYRIVIADARTKRDGRAIEEIGIYQPKEEPSLIRVDSERAQYWLGVGAQPTEAVFAILKITGDWQKFKGLPGAEGTLRVAEPKADKKSVFEAAAKDAANEPVKEATTPKKKAAPAAEAAPAADAAPAAEVVEAAAEAAPAAEVVEAAAEAAPAAEVVEAAAEAAPAAEETPAEAAPAAEVAEEAPAAEVAADTAGAPEAPETTEA
jgi:small subunit ribosomal protein S16